MLGLAVQLRQRALDAVLLGAAVRGGRAARLQRRRQLGKVPLLRRQRVRERPMPNRSSHQVRPPACAWEAEEFVFVPVWVSYEFSSISDVCKVLRLWPTAETGRSCSRDGLQVDLRAAPKWRKAATTPQARRVMMTWIQIPPSALALCGGEIGGAVAQEK